MNDTTSKEQSQKTAGKKITIEVDEDDPCLRKHKQQEQTALLGKHFGYDPRCANEKFKVYRAYLTLYDSSQISAAKSDTEVLRHVHRFLSLRTYIR